MLNPPMVERFTWVALGGLLLVAIVRGAVDRGGKDVDRGLLLATIGSVLVMAAWVLLAVSQHLNWEYYVRYGYLGGLPVLILLGYFSFEPVLWGWHIVLFGVLAIVILSFVGYLFWPFWVIGFVLASEGGE